MTEAVVKYGEVELRYVPGDDEVTSVFAGEKGELVIVRDHTVTKYYGCPFVVTNERKDKTIVRD